MVVENFVRWPIGTLRFAFAFATGTSWGSSSNPCNGAVAIPWFSVVRGESTNWSKVAKLASDAEPVEKKFDVEAVPTDPATRTSAALPVVETAVEKPPDDMRDAPDTMR
jgi:hypothetical protein